MDESKPQLGPVQEVARARRCSVATVWRGVAKGEIPQPIRLGGRTLWDMREIHAEIEAKLAARHGVAAT